MKKSIYILSIAILGIMGCNKNLDVEYENDYNTDKIRIQADINNTRVSGTSFETGDVLSLYAVEYSGDEVANLQVSGNYLNNVVFSYDGSEWVSRRPLYWSDKPCDFYAIYPYQQPQNVSQYLFDIATDQNSPETEDALSGYEASDLLWAKAEKHSQQDGTVALRFKHMMSRVVVKLERGEKYEGELPEDITVHLYNTATTAEVDLTKGSLQRYAHSEKKTITMRQLSGDTFAAVVVPQNIYLKTPLVEITMEGIAYLLSHSISLRPGYQHTITVTLNTSPEQEKIEIEIEGDVEDWE